MRGSSRAYRGRSARQGMVVLLVALAAGWGVAQNVAPRIERAVHGTLFGDNPNVGPPVVCRSGDVLAGVYNPWRLVVHQRCATAIGRVVFVLHAPDGDYHISLLPDRGYWRLLNRTNYTHQGGTLVVEVIPSDQASVPIPQVGAHVRVTGPWVTDNEHGWQEIHPAWQIVSMP